MSSTSFIIKDANNELVKLTASSITEEGEEKLSEKIIIGSGAIRLPTDPQVLEVTNIGEYPIGKIDIQAKANIVVKTTFSVAASYVKIRFTFYDTNSIIIGTSIEYEIISTGRLLTDNRFLGEMISIDNTRIEASLLTINVTVGVSNGDVSFYVAGI